MLCAYQYRGWVVGVFVGICGFGPLNVEAPVGLGEVGAGEVLDERDMAGLVVGFEGRGGGTGFAVGVDKDGEWHYCRIETSQSISCIGGILLEI